MPSSTMEEELPHKLPKDQPLHAKLTAVTVKTIRWQKDGKPKQRDVWRWEFEILDSEYAGLHAYGETEDKLTTHPDNKVRQWGETLSGVQFGLGDGINTNDYLGIQCAIMLDWTERDRSDGKGKFYDEPVVDVLPLAVLAEMAGGFTSGNQTDGPPF